MNANTYGKDVRISNTPIHVSIVWFLQQNIKKALNVAQETNDSWMLFYVALYTCTLKPHAHYE